MTYDALVVGGGPAGAALAIELGRAGRSVALCEKELEPHDKVCGEFLSHEAGSYLARLGIDPEALGSVPIGRVRLAFGNRSITAKLPFRAQSLSRRVLDDALLKQAAAASVEVRRGQRVTALEGQAGGWLAVLDNGARLMAREAFLATGKHDLRGWKRPPGTQPDLIGFKMYYRLAPQQSDELNGHVELSLFPGGYVGLQPVEGGRANLCLLVRRQTFAGLGQSWIGLLACMTDHSDHLAVRLQDAESCLPRPLAIASIPYGYVAPAEDGPWRLGDQAAVIPSFSGDGMSIALHSARLAADHLLEGRSAMAYQAQLKRDVRKQIWMSTRISRALVTSTGQWTAMGLSRLAPRLMTDLAHMTRISRSALERAA